MHRKSPIIIVVVFLALISCTFPQMFTDQTAEETLMVLGIQATMQAAQQETIDAAVGANALATYTPQELYTAKPPDTPVPETEVPPTPEATATKDIQASIRAANILVFEDWDGPIYKYVTKAIKGMSFSGGRIVDVGDAVGNFKSNLQSGDWDLIIAASESRSGVQGEFWDYLQNQVNNNVGLIAEIWHMDKHYTDVQSLFMQCGLKFHKNWARPAGYNPLDYSILFLDPSHPIFNTPNSGFALTNPSWIYWKPPLTDDAGDLMQLSGGGDAQLLAGIFQKESSRYGVIATCMDGRVIFQTFSDHDYPEGDVIALWQNYITYTLTNHFMAVP